MIDILPDEMVMLHLNGEMTVRSAVRKVMLEWSVQKRDGARTAGEAVIFRKGEPPMLGIAEIEKLWSKPEFQDD